MLFHKNQFMGIINKTIHKSLVLDRELLNVDIIAPKNVLISICHQDKVFRGIVMVFGDIQRNIGWHIVCPD